MYRCMGRPKGPGQGLTSRGSKEIRFRGAKLDARRLAFLAKVWETTPSEVMRRLLAEKSKELGHE